MGGQEKVEDITKAQEIPCGCGPGRTRHAPVENIDKDVIEEQVANGWNNHRNHGVPRFAFGTDDRIPHHTQGEKGYPVEHYGVVDLGGLKDAVLTPKSGNQTVSVPQSKQNHAASEQYG